MSRTKTKVTLVEAPVAPAQQDPPRGLECPACGCGHFFTVYTRPTILKRIMRRRECRHCGRRVTTYEHA